jgi:hypothetical protein
MTTLDTLERLAKEACPGPWSHGLDMDPPDSTIEAGNNGAVCHIQEHGSMNTVNRTGERFSHDDARYIAALDPDTILKLIAVCRAAEKALEFIITMEKYKELKEALAALESKDSQ